METNTKPELPPILVLSSIKPSISEDGELKSPNLLKRLGKYDQLETELWERFTHTDDPVMEERLGSQLAKLYLLRESTNLAMPDLEEEGFVAGSPYALRPSMLHAERFTDLAKSIYGELTPDRILQAASSTVELAASLTDDETAFPLLRRVATAARGETPAASAELLMESKLRTQISNELQNRYSQQLELIDELPDEEFSPAEMQQIFSELLSSLAEGDADWGQWQVELTPDKGMISVKSRDKVISIGADRQHSNKADIKKLFVHEIGVHAQRSLNGEKINDPEHLLQYGLPGYIDAEEGLGVLFEYAISGNLPTKAMDRYFDIALATGDAGLILSHSEILQLKIERETVRRQRTGDPIDREQIRKHSLAETNRIFRGGDGKIHEEDCYGRRHLANAVFVKDIVYFQSLLPLVNTIEQLADKGQPIAEIVSYLQLGKFDPSNQTHLDYLKRWTTLKY